jgi:hypothetical protein
MPVCQGGHRGWLSQSQILEMLADTALGAASAAASAVMSAGMSARATAGMASSRREQRGRKELDDMRDGLQGIG